MSRLHASLGAALVALALVACAGPSATLSPPASVPASAASPVATPSTEPSASPTVEPTLAQPAWRQVTVPPGGPAAREDHTWTLAADGTTAYLFGGRTADGTALADLWAYDLEAGTWRALEQSGPQARFGHNAAWVDDVGLVIFAGQQGSTFFNDLWAFDPAAGAWRALPARGDVPVARYGSCAALGPDGRFWVSHGFTEDLRRFADTRAYDFTGETWTDETPPADLPLARCLHACWWTADGALVLYAGQTTGITALGDLWRLTPGPRQGTHTWTELAGGERPPDRNLYASARWGEATVIFGGQALDGDHLADLWLLHDDGDASMLVPGGEAPPARSGAELVADQVGGRLLLFGGRDAQVAMSDLWELTLPAP